MATYKQKLMLLQDLLREKTSYTGSTNGQVNEDDQEQILRIIEESHRLSNETINAIIRTMFVCGFSDNLEENGVVDESFANGLRNAFNIRTFSLAQAA